MGNRSIFLYRVSMRRGDGEGYSGRGLEVPVQACRRVRQANPVGQTLRRDDERPLGCEVLEARLPGKASKRSVETRPYRKPTQVGELNMLRRLRELG